MRTENGPAPATVVGYRRLERLLVVVGLPLAATTVGVLLPPLARLLLGLDTALPFGVVLRVIGSVDRPAEVLVNTAIWLLVGIGAAWTAFGEEAQVVVGDDRVVVRARGVVRGLDRTEVGVAFVDGRDLVILDRLGVPRVRAATRGGTAALASAFGSHRYPWRATDPFATSYRAWNGDQGADAGDVDLPAGAAALLRLRGRHLRGHDAEQARELRDALAGLGVVVRDDGPLQFWRPVVPLDDGTPTADPDATGSDHCGASGDRTP